MTADRLPPVHPGEVLQEEFLTPMGLSQTKLALAISVPPRRINEVVRQKRPVTMDTAIRLSLFFGNSAAFWMGLQMDYDLEVTEADLRERLRPEVRPYSELAA